jgi:hypothetical protein
MVLYEICKNTVTEYFLHALYYDDFLYQFLLGVVALFFMTAILLWLYIIVWTCQWFSQGPPVSSTNKTDCHDINEILLKVALNTI